jgi:outer membrane receptor protein involved in Fe transport
VRYGIRSLHEAINFLALGMMTTNPLHAVEVGSRGVLLTGDRGGHVLLLINGHVVNEPLHGTAFYERGAGIPMELIDRIEVTLGPGSVSHGDSAVLGVIHVITKRAQDFRGIHLIAETELLTSIRGAAGAGIEWSALGLPGELLLEVDYYVQSGPSFDLGPQAYGADAVTGQPKRFLEDGPATGVWGGEATDSYTTRVPSIYAQLRFGPIELNARASAYRRSAPYLHPISAPMGDFNDPNTHQIDQIVGLDLRYRRAVSEALRLRARLYLDFYNASWNNTSSAAEDCPEGQVSGCRRLLVGSSKWGGLEAVGIYDWTGRGAIVTRLGIDGRYRGMESKLNIIDRSTGVSPGSFGEIDESSGLFAIYAEQEARLSSWLKLDGGFRANFGGGFGANLSPRGVVTLLPWQGAALRGIYTEVSRPPTAYERLHADPITRIASPDLTAETARSVEASFEQRFGQQRVFTSAFRSFYTDMVLLSRVTEGELVAARSAGLLAPGASLSTVYRYQNIPSIDVYGASAAYEGTGLDSALRFGVQVTGSYSRRETESGPLPLTVAPQLFGNARVSYDLPGSLPSLALAGYLVGARPADRAFDAGFTPSPHVSPLVEVRATASGSIPWVKGLSYRLSANVALGEGGPYVIGPVQSPTLEQPAAELSPIDHFRTAIGLRYDP